MAYGFNEDKTKVPVYSKEETYSKEELYTKDQLYPKEDLYNKEEVYSKGEVYNKEQADAVFDPIEEEGTTGGWTWIKYKSGRYEAERLVNYGTVTANSVMLTVEGNIKLYSTPAIPVNPILPPHTLVSGEVVYSCPGNSQGYALLMQTTGNRIQLGRFSSASFAFTGVKILCRVVNGRWK